MFPESLKMILFCFILELGQDIFFSNLKKGWLKRGMTKIYKIMSCMEKLDRGQVFIASSKTKPVGDQFKLSGATLETNESFLHVAERRSKELQAKRCSEGQKLAGVLRNTEQLHRK